MSVWQFCTCTERHHNPRKSTMTESGKRLTLDTLSEKMEKAVNALQNHIDDKLTAMLEEIKGIRLSQYFLCEKYEDMKKKLETITDFSQSARGKQ